MKKPKSAKNLVVKTGEKTPSFTVRKVNLSAEKKALKQALAAEKARAKARERSQKLKQRAAEKKAREAERIKQKELRAKARERAKIERAAQKEKAFKAEAARLNRNIERFKSRTREGTFSVSVKKIDIENRADLRKQRAAFERAKKEKKTYQKIENFYQAQTRYNREIAGGSIASSVHFKPRNEREIAEARRIIKRLTRAHKSDLKDNRYRNTKLGQEAKKIAAELNKKKKLPRGETRLALITRKINPEKEPAKRSPIPRGTSKEEAKAIYNKMGSRRSVSEYHLNFIAAAEVSGLDWLAQLARENGSEWTYFLYNNNFNIKEFYLQALTEAGFDEKKPDYNEEVRRSLNEALQNWETNAEPEEMDFEEEASAQAQRTMDLIKVFTEELERAQREGNVEAEDYNRYMVLRLEKENERRRKNKAARAKTRRRSAKADSGA